MKLYFIKAVVFFLIGMPLSCAFAESMVPETSVVLISAGDGEGSINVKNSSAEAALLYTSLENLSGGDDNSLIVTAPIVRVDAGEKQLVRFILQEGEPITTQRMKRVIFEGIPQQNSTGGNKVKINVRHHLPVIISPANLPRKDDPWTLIKWTLDEDVLKVANDSPYVVRLNEQLQLLPSGFLLRLPQAYLLPGQSHSLALPAGVNLSAQVGVRLQPASIYGFHRGFYDAALNP